MGVADLVHGPVVMGAMRRTRGRTSQCLYRITTTNLIDPQHSFTVTAANLVANNR